MALPNDPEKIPKERGWEVVPIFSSNGFNSAYLSALQEIDSDSEIAGHSDVGVRNLLFTLVLSLRPECVLELGGHIGSAALVMGEALRLNGYGKLYSIEPQAHYLNRFSYYINKAELQRIVIPLKGFSYDRQIKTTLSVLAPFELIFIDACHDFSAVYDELLYCYELIAPHGLIVLHDSSIFAQSFDTQRAGGVRRAIVECCKEKPGLQTIFFEYPLWLNNCGAAILCKQEILDSTKNKTFVNSDLYSRIGRWLTTTKA